MNKITTYLIVAAFMSPFWTVAQFSESREIVKRFSVLPETQIEISNKYGKIDIKTWDKDSAVFRINIRVEEKKLSKLEESLKGIDFDITNSGHYLVVSTEVQKNKSGLAKEIKNFKETLLSSDGTIQVDYTVWIPNSNRLKIENKYGDIYIGDYKGDIKIDLSNGNLKAYNFENGLDLTLNFADATINKIVKGNLNCNFSELYVKKTDVMKLISRSSEFEFQEITELNADSRRDKFRIQQADLIEAQGSFSNFRISELTDRANIRTEYGDLEIEKTAPDFGGIVIQSKSTDISLYLPKEKPFNFEINHTKTDLSLDDGIVTEKTEASDDGKTTHLKGYVGSKSKNHPKLGITADSGEINIRLR